VTRPVTIITISTHPGLHPSEWNDVAFTDEAMATIHSVQEQDIGPTMWDLSIIRKVDETSARQLYEFAAKHATTPWLAFVDEGTVLPPSALRRALLDVAASPEQVRVGTDDVTLWRRDYYLEGAGA
jgi:hypothetical protein